MSEEKRPEWMTSIASNVNPEDYLLGRKIDKTFELSQKEKAEKARDARIELLAKDKIRLSDDPILDLERRRRELKMEVIQNPVLLKHFRDRLLKETRLGRKRSSDGTADFKSDRHQECPSNLERRQDAKGDSSNYRESKEDRHKHRDDDSIYRRLPENEAKHRDTTPRDHESRQRNFKHDISRSGRRESSQHGSRHSVSRHKHRSSHGSRSRSRSPSSRHGHRHRHHERHHRSRSPTHQRRS